MKRRRPADLVVLEETGDGDFAMVKAASAAGRRWVLSQPAPINIDDPIDYDLIVEAQEVKKAERRGLVVWRVLRGGARAARS